MLQDNVRDGMLLSEIKNDGDAITVCGVLTYMCITEFKKLGLLCWPILCTPLRWLLPGVGNQKPESEFNSKTCDFIC